MQSQLVKHITYLKSYIYANTWILAHHYWYIISWTAYTNFFINFKNILHISSECTIMRLNICICWYFQYLGFLFSYYFYGSLLCICGIRFRQHMMYICNTAHFDFCFNLQKFQNQICSWIWTYQRYYHMHFS
jgi:hypothetical protein